MEMQDKSMLPKLLQKRIGNFGKKGQSKYTHLTQEDTSDLNPLTRPDESLLDYWKKRTAGYKGSYKSNVWSAYRIHLSEWSHLVRRYIFSPRYRSFLPSSSD